ncbi:MAG: pantoate--beta-alanine ligase [Thermodesulfobacteriota bacterium]
MRVITKIDEMRRFSSSARSEGKSLVVVPTMGALHRGHGELLKMGRAAGDLLILTIFVNPAQFAPGEDFRAYPRDMDGDLRAAESEGVDVVFSPSPDEMYGEGYETYVEVQGLSKNLCGASRPGHFQGVATVVLKLFNITSPHKAIFGKKDFQQLVVIKRMVADLNLDVEIIGAGTVREADGLAVSSRNAYLSAEERRAAASIPRALQEAREAVAGGVTASAAIVERVAAVLRAGGLTEPEYIKVCDPVTLEEVDSVEPGSGTLIALAVRVGRARLIDNIQV